MKFNLIFCFAATFLGACHLPVAYVLDVPPNQEVEAFYRYSDDRPWIPFEVVTDLRASARIEGGDLLVYISYAGNPPKYIQVRAEGELLELSSRMEGGKLLFIDGLGNQIETSSSHVDFNSKGDSGKIIIDRDGLGALSGGMSAKVLKIE